MMIYQLWQHMTSGEVYVVQTDYGMLLAAAGPLDYTEHAQALSGDFDDDPDVREDLTNHPDQYRLVADAPAAGGPE